MDTTGDEVIYTGDESLPRRQNGLQIFGFSGFVGSAYFRKYQFNTSVNLARHNFRVFEPNVLNFISTVHNYNIYEDSCVDINTNLVTLMKMLDSWKYYQEETGNYGVFNFVSSWFVYGKNSIGVRETEVCDPKGFYSITKRTAEQLLISYCDTFGLKYRILRLANVVGPGDKKVSKQKNALQYLVNRLKANEPIQLYKNGQFYRDYIHVDDCADAIRVVVQDGQPNTIYNIGNGHPVKFRDLIDIAANITQSKSKITEMEPTDFHKTVQVESFSMDNSRLRDLGYAPKHNLYSMIESICIT